MWPKRSKSHKLGWLSALGRRQMEHLCPCGSHGSVLTHEFVISPFRGWTFGGSEPEKKSENQRGGGCREGNRVERLVEGIGGPAEMKAGEGSQRGASLVTREEPEQHHPEYKTKNFFRCVVSWFCGPTDALPTFHPNPKYRPGTVFFIFIFGAIITKQISSVRDVCKNRTLFHFVWKNSHQPR